MVTHQLQVERRTGKVRQSETDVLPLCYATNCPLGLQNDSVAASMTLSMAMCLVRLCHNSHVGVRRDFWTDRADFWHGVIGVILRHILYTVL